MIMLSKMLYYVPRVPSCPKCLTCLTCLRALSFHVHYKPACLCAFASYVPFLFYVPYVLSFFMYLTCLHFFYVPYVSWFFYVLCGPSVFTCFTMCLHFFPFRLRAFAFLICLHIFYEPSFFYMTSSLTVFIFYVSSLNYVLSLLLYAAIFFTFIFVNCFKFFAHLTGLHFLHSLRCFIFFLSSGKWRWKRGIDWFFLFFPTLLGSL